MLNTDEYFITTLGLKIRNNRKESDIIGILDHLYSDI